MSSLALLAELAREFPRQVTFTQDRCLRRRLNRCECVDCLDVCPAECLSIRGNQVNFSQATCTGCMACTSACPNDAFTVPGFNLEGPLGVQPDRELMVTCSRQPQSHPNEYVIPCVGGLTTEVLLALGITRTAPTLINVSGCRNCENSSVAAAVTELLTKLQERFPELFVSRIEPIAELRPKSATEAGNRRYFLSGIKQNVISTVAARLNSMSPAEEDCRKNRRPATVRVGLVLKLLDLTDGPQRAIIQSLCVYHLEVNETCTQCPLCKGICPTGALTIERDDQVKRLRTDPTLCSGCGLCVTFCKRDALQLTPPPQSKRLPTITKRSAKLATEGALKEMQTSRE